MSAAPPPASTAASDAALIAAIAQGDRDAFIMLFERYAGRVKGYLMRTGTSAADADEITQDVMVAVWRHAARFDPARAAASTWIFAIARNRRIDVVRRVRPAPDPDEPLLHPEPEPDALEILGAAEREAQLRAALAQLSEAQRRVLVAAFYDGLSHPEIAARDGLPLGTVKSRIRLAFARLNAILAPEMRAELGEGLGDD